MSAGTGWVYEEAFLDHLIEPGHPESPERLRAIRRKVEETGLASHLLRIRPSVDPLPHLPAVHRGDHVDSVRALPVTGPVALLAMSGTLSAVDAVCRGEVGRAFCALRPPGHHAHDLGEEEGFCYFNNVAVAARYAQEVHKLAKVLIIDWDYHHGNGTEDAFYDDPSVFYFSTHKLRAYPGTGSPARKGAGDGVGFNLNVDLPGGAADRDILLAWEKEFLPRAEAFAPDLVLVSAGFDSRVNDWLGDFRITDDAFARMTRMAMQLAAASAGGRLVSLLEGGYNPEGLASGVAAHLGELASG